MVIKNNSKILKKDKEELSQIINNHLNEHVSSVKLKVLKT